MNYDENIEEVVANLNELLDEDTAQQHAFYYQGNGFLTAILFDDVILWDSENDNREYLGEETDRHETIFECVKREFDEYVQRLNTITQDEKIVTPLNHLYKDMLMLESGEWVPDKHSISATLGNIEEIAERLKIELKEEQNE